MFFRRFWRNERGQILFETIVTLPVIAMLIGSLLGLFVFSARFYRNTMANIELMSEVRLAMERVLEDASRSRQFSVDTVGSRLTMYRIHTGAAGSEDEVAYFLRNDQNTGAVRLCRNAHNEPITGASDFGEVTVTAFNCRAVGQRLRVELTGKSITTGKVFSLRTEIFMEGGAR